MSNLSQMAAAQNAKAKMENEARERTIALMKKEPFPPERTSEYWRSKVAKAIIKSAPLAHQLSLSDFADIVAVDPMLKRLTYFEYGVLSNSLEAVSPEALAMDNATYKKFISEECVPHIKYWNEREQAWERQFLEQILTDEQMRLAAIKDKMTPGNKLTKA